MEISRPATLDHLGDLMQFASDFVADLPLNEESIMQIELALEEVLVNVINYAYANKPEGGEIQLLCQSLATQQILFQVTDWGEFFDPLTRDDPDVEADPDDRDIGGLGIYLAKKVMAMVSYERDGDRNVLTMIKNQDP